MSVRVKLVAIILFVAIVPLGVSAFTALGIHRRAYDGKVTDLHRATASSGALWVSERLAALRRSVAGVASAIPWTSATAEEREGALWLLYQQADDVAIASLFDATRASIGRSAVIDDRDDDPRFSHHPVVDVDALGRFYAAVPFDRPADRPAIGAAFAGSAGEPLLPIAIAAGDDRTWTVAVAVSLAGLCANARELGGDRTEIVIVDRAGRRICAAGGAPALSPIDAALRGRLGAAGGELIGYRDRHGHELIAAAAATGDGWTVIAQQPASALGATGERMQLQTAFWIGIAALAALAAGLYLARGISRPVRELVRGVDQLAGGNLGYRVHVDATDELGHLATGFNRMSDELAERNAEIEAFNAELMQRVDERTRQLREAEKQLLQSQKLAAMSSLAAGVAHEINNPLTGVIGIAQLLKLQAAGEPDADKRTAMLTKVEGEAKRIRDIVQTMLSLSGREAGDEMIEIDPVIAIDDAIARTGSRVAAAGIEIRRDLPARSPRIRGNTTQLAQVIAHLISNSVTAMPDGGRIDISLREVAGELIQLRVADTGYGIPREQLERVFEPFFTTKKEWQGRGLGLAVAYRIVEQHNGTITIDSEVGVGTRVTIAIPIARGGAHLV